MAAVSNSPGVSLPLWALELGVSEELSAQYNLFPDFDLEDYLDGAMLVDFNPEEREALRLADSSSSSADHRTPSASGVGSAAASDAARSPGGRTQYSHQSTVQPFSHGSGSTARGLSPGGRTQFTYQLGDQLTALPRGWGVESLPGDSLSPGDERMLTPASTGGHNASASEGPHASDDEEILLQLSPMSTAHTTNSDLPMLSPYNSSAESNTSPVVRMNNNRPPPTTPGSGAAHSRASSVAPPTSSSAFALTSGLVATMAGAHPTTSSFAPQSSSSAVPFAGGWGAIAPTASAWPNQHDSHSDLYASFTSDYSLGHSFASSNQAGEDLLTGMDTINYGTMADSNAALPLRTVAGTMPMYQPHFPDTSAFFQNQSQQQYQQGQQSMIPQNFQRMQNFNAQDTALRRPHGNLSQPSRLNIPTTAPSRQPLYNQSLQPAPVDLAQGNMLSPHTLMQSAFERTPRAHTQNQPVVRSNTPSTASTATVQQARQQVSHNAAQQATVAGPSQRPIAPIKPGTLQSNARRASSGGNRPRGGRQRHTHLSKEKRDKASLMRNMAACWRCALQRDPCDNNSPCNRCVMKSQKGQAHFFPCDRTKLPVLIHDFLPTSMTMMHQKQGIEDCVKAEVVNWDLEHPIDVYLTSGYGPPLRWKLHEFRPKTEELLMQYQYLQDPKTGRSHRHDKYSPPFGLIKLDAADDAHFEEYLEIALGPQYLSSFGMRCFEEELQVDPEGFQAHLLHLLCQFYTRAENYELQQVLQQILRMMLITYIMGHTLTITEDILPSVIHSVRMSQTKPVGPHTSPRLANRQLKFFFSVLRNKIYEGLLRWQQSTLHTSGKKEATWVAAFCSTLGFALVLEEVQRTIQIQADAKAAKGELNWEQAQIEAMNACERIDDRFALLTGLFQCKYRDRKWNHTGSFGNGTPNFEKTEPVTHQFLIQMRSLLERRADHLQNRKNVEFSSENQCKYTSRLVARFLLPFLELPP